MKEKLIQYCLEKIIYDFVRNFPLISLIYVDQKNLYRFSIDYYNQQLQ